jgi:hypothetical protein
MANARNPDRSYGRSIQCQAQRAIELDAGPGMRGRSGRLEGRACGVSVADAETVAPCGLGASLSRRGRALSQRGCPSWPGASMLHTRDLIPSFMQLSRSSARHSALRRTAGPAKLARPARLYAPHRFGQCVGEFKRAQLDDMIPAFDPAAVVCYDRCRRCIAARSLTARLQPSLRGQRGHITSAPSRTDPRILQRR